MTSPQRQGNEEHEAALGLAWLGTSGGRGLLRLAKEEGVDAVWRASSRQLAKWGVHSRLIDEFRRWRRDFEPTRVTRQLAQSGIRFVPLGAAGYPPELMHLDLPPAGLFLRGSHEALEQLLRGPRVTIVGTRKATPDGLRAAEAFTAAFSLRGIAVISGMALGIDGRAHSACMDAHGLTVAILGCGVDLVYPPRHRWLYRQIQEKGLVLSELPPGTTPTRWTFPHRNRLLAALGDGVLVVEASLTSGALQTSGWALSLGRAVFSVPGSVFAEGYVGCNRLLHEGAAVACDPETTVEDFLAQTRIERGERKEASPQSKGVTRFEKGAEPGSGVSTTGGGGREAQVLEVLACGPCTVDALIAQTGLGVRDVGVALAELGLAGSVKRSGPGTYIRAP